MTHVSSKASSLPVRRRFYSKLSQSSEKIKTISIVEVQLAKFEDSQRGRSNSESGIREGLNMMVGFRAEIDIIYVIFRAAQTSRFTYS